MCIRLLKTIWQLLSKTQQKLRSEVEKYDSDKKIYERNPYTNLDLLVEEIQNPDFKENNEAFWTDFYK